MLVSTLWFSGSINAMTSSDVTLDDQKTRWRQYGGNMALNGYNSSSITARDPMLVSTLWLRSTNSMMSSDLKLHEQKTRRGSIWLKFDI